MLLRAHRTSLELCCYVDTIPPRDSIPPLQLLHDAQHFHTMLDVEEGGVCTVTLASKLLGVGYRHVALRRAEGGGAGSECFHNLRHSFLVVQGEGVDEGIDFIVEVGTGWKAWGVADWTSPRHRGSRLRHALPSTPCTSPPSRCSPTSGRASRSASRRRGTLACCAWCPSSWWPARRSCARWWSCCSAR